MQAKKSRIRQSLRRGFRQRCANLVGFDGDAWFRGRWTWVFAAWARIALAPNDGLLEQLGSAAQMELLFQLFAVGLDGLDAETEPLGDVAGGKAIADQLKDLQFPVAQALQGR